MAIQTINYQILNNFATTLLASITANSTTMSLTNTTGLPTTISLEYPVILTLFDGTNTEIVMVTSAPNGASVDITRGIDGTTPRAFAMNTTVESRVTKGILESLSIPKVHPSIRPSFMADIKASKTLDPRISFTRASSATYFDGSTFLADSNMFLYSQDFDNVAWVKDGVAITPNVVAAPDGSITADYMVGIGGTSAPRKIYQGDEIYGVTSNTVSVYAKSSTGDYLQVYTSYSSTSYANFNLKDGTFNQYGNVTVEMTPVSGSVGWYRCAVTFNYSQTGGVSIMMGLVSSDTAAFAESNSLTTGIFIWGAQNEAHTNVSAYIPTTNVRIASWQSKLVTAINNQPRIDYDPITNQCKGLLIEEARTNYLTYSSTPSNAAWLTTNGASKAVDRYIAPDGTESAVLFKDNASVSAHGIKFSPSFTAGETYTFSVFMKPAGITEVMLSFGSLSFGDFLGATFDLTTGTYSAVNATRASVAPVGGGWYRCSITGTATSTVIDQLFSQHHNSSGLNSYLGDVTKGVIYWGAQLEIGTNVTSYIPTTSASVTREYEYPLIQETGLRTFYDEGHGTWYVSGDSDAVLSGSTNSSYKFIFVSQGGATDDNIYMTFLNNVARANVSLGGVSLSARDVGTPLSSPGEFKQALAFSNSVLKNSFNGLLATNSNVIGAAPYITQAKLGYHTTTYGFLNGHLAKLAFYPAVLSDNELKSLTTI